MIWKRNYWLIVGPRNAARPEVAAFCDWLKAQALLTREAMGDIPNADTVDKLDREGVVAEDRASTHDVGIDTKKQRHTIDTVSS